MAEGRGLMRALFDGIRRIVGASEPDLVDAAPERAPAQLPPPVPLERTGPGRYDPIAHETMAGIAAVRAPLDFAVPAHALAEIAGLRRQLAEATAAARGRTLSQLTADMPKTEGGRISELAAVRADRDRLEQVNDRLRAELAELRAKLAGTT
jgi:hypothetical protein